MKTIKSVSLKRKIVEYLFSKGRSLYYRTLKLLKGKKGLMMIRVLDSDMNVNLEDKGISVDLIIDRIREPYSTEFLKSILKEGEVVLDIGANIGYYALYEAKMVGPKGKVYAVEPVPDNFKLLKKNIEINGYKNAEIFCLGIAEKKGVSNMYICEAANLSSMVKKEKSRVKKQITVDTTTVDGFLKDKLFPSFIRMDVEGFEDNIVKGMRGALKDPRLNKLFIELHPHIMEKEQTCSLLNALKYNGFEILKIFRSEGSNFRWALNNRLGLIDEEVFPATIEQLLKNDGIISGKEGAFEIFFGR